MQPRKNATTVNVGNIYIGDSTLNVATKTGIFAVLSPEQVQGLSIRSADESQADLSQWYVDADNANDAVLVSYIQ